MTRPCYFLCIILFPCLFSCKEAPNSGIRINAVFPSSNPVGGPVKIVGEGFTDDTELYFEGVDAVIELRSDTFLTAKVPRGISGSGISITVENTEGSDRLSDYFEVLSSYPSNLPVSPPSIFIPAPGGVTALPFTQSSADIINHMNVYDTDHVFEFLIRREEEEFRSQEVLPVNGTEYRSNLLTDGNELLSYVDSIATLSMLSVDRANSNPAGHPYTSEEYSAVYFRDSTFIWPRGFLNSLENRVPTKNFLLIESNSTKRQYLFVVYCPGSTLDDCL